MQLLHATLAAVLTSIVVAQNSTQLVKQLPICAYTCLVTAGQASGCLDTTDFSCFCGEHKEAIIKISVPCIAKGCSTVDSLITQKVATQICKAEAPVISSIVAAFSSTATVNLSLASMSAFANSTASTASNTSTSSTSSLSSATAPTIPTSNTLTSSTTVSSTASSPPAQTSSSIGSKLEVGGFMAGAALLAAFAL